MKVMWQSMGYHLFSAFSLVRRRIFCSKDEVERGVK